MAVATSSQIGTSVMVLGLGGVEVDSRFNSVKSRVDKRMNQSKGRRKVKFVMNDCIYLIYYIVI